MVANFLTSIFNYVEGECPFEVVFRGDVLMSPTSTPERRKLDKLASDVAYSLWCLRGVEIVRMEVVKPFHDHDHHATVRAFGPHGHRIGTFHIPDSEVWLESMRRTTFVGLQEHHVRERPLAFSRVLWYRVVDLPMILVI